MLEFRTEKLSGRVTRIYAFATGLMYLVEENDLPMSFRGDNALIAKRPGPDRRPLGHGNGRCWTRAIGTQQLVFR